MSQDHVIGDFRNLVSEIWLAEIHDAKISHYSKAPIFLELGSEYKSQYKILNSFTGKATGATYVNHLYNIYFFLKKMQI